MKLTVRFFRLASGAKPVASYLRSLERQERQKIAAVLFDLQEHGLSGSLADLKHVEDRLWEIRVSNHRVLYVMVRTPTELVVLHAFKKEGHKMPRSDKELALKRMSAEIDEEMKREAARRPKEEKKP